MRFRRTYVMSADPDFSDDVFPGTTIPVANNTRSLGNRDTVSWLFYTRANYQGAVGCIPPGHFGTPSETFRNTILSARWSTVAC